MTPLRDTILDLIKARQGATPNEIAEALGRGKPAIGYHLRMLTDAGALTAETLPGSSRELRYFTTLPPPRPVPVPSIWAYAATFR